MSDITLTTNTPGHSDTGRGAVALGTVYHPAGTVSDLFRRCGTRCDVDVFRHPVHEFFHDARHLLGFPCH
ncbi:CbtB-domain containing protein [Klebsiella variicola subsp. variicola]|nr:CbtB-domain containing protein [Klebsiella variicola subsp. variicola]